MKDIETIVCGNEACRYGIDGRPKVSIKKRSHKEYCCAICRNEAHRNKQSGGARLSKLEKLVEKLAIERLVGGNKVKKRLELLEEKIDWLVRMEVNLEKEVEALKFTVEQLVNFVLGRITKDEVSEIIKKVGG